MLTVISSGHPDLADVLLLVGFVLFILASITQAPPTRAQGDPWWRFLIAAGLAALALAWLVL